MFLQKISLLMSLLSPLAWFIWFTYAVILPLCTFLVIADVFVIIQLLKVTYSEDDEYETFLTTREALKTIFPEASNKDIKKYDKQLDKVKDFEPVLIISPNHNWINQHTLQNYQMVMNAFAIDSLQQNNRRDGNSLLIFHFSTMTELYTVRQNVRTLHPNAYFNPVAQPKQEPIGAAWIFYKVGASKCDFGEDDNFFIC
ncbi:unnamed protein product [Rhizophagus irregularis]|nr:unnamed protein product [Rhizophagus irregularis]